MHSNRLNPTHFIYHSIYLMRPKIFLTRSSIDSIQMLHTHLWFFGWQRQPYHRLSISSPIHNLLRRNTKSLVEVSVMVADGALGSPNHTAKSPNVCIYLWPSASIASIKCRITIICAIRVSTTALVPMQAETIKC